VLSKSVDKVHTPRWQCAPLWATHRLRPYPQRRSRTDSAPGARCRWRNAWSAARNSSTTPARSASSNTRPDWARSSLRSNT